MQAKKRILSTDLRGFREHFDQICTGECELTSDLRDAQNWQPGPNEVLIGSPEFYAKLDDVAAGRITAVSRPHAEQFLPEPPKPRTTLEALEEAAKRDWLWR